MARGLPGLTLAFVYYDNMVGDDRRVINAKGAAILTMARTVPAAGAEKPLESFCLKLIAKPS